LSEEERDDELEELKDMLEELVKDAKAVYISDDPENPFILVDRGPRGLSFLAPGSEGRFRVVNIDLSLIASIDNILQDTIGRYVSGEAIVTIGCGEPDMFYTHRWDVKRRGRRLFYGYSKQHYLLLVARISWCIENWGFATLILRSFTRRIDRKTGLPIKQIRGFYLVRGQRGLELERVSLEDLIEAETTDFITGEKLPPEPSVEYCYENTCIASDNIKEK